MDEMDDYEPTDEELRELEELMNSEQEQKEAKEEFEQRTAKMIKGRKIFNFQTESHWIGWLKVNGIRW